MIKAEFKISDKFISEDAHIYNLIREYEVSVNKATNALAIMKDLMYESIHNANDEKMRRLRSEKDRISENVLQPSNNRQNSILIELNTLGFNQTSELLMSAKKKFQLSVGIDRGYY